MRHAWGLAAMLLAIIAIFIPFVGPYLTIAGALLVVFAGYAGSAYAIVVVVLNVVNLLFLSPSLLLTAGLFQLRYSLFDVFINITTLVVIQLIALVILLAVNRMKKKQFNAISD